MSQVTNPDAILSNERLISASPQMIFAAFEDPETLARWWGPKGFRSTFETFEFKPGGRWIFVMHGPDGIDYPNNSAFREIEPNRKIVIAHDCEPFFTLTVTLNARGERTHLTWVQEFERAAVAAKFREICTPLNEENLDRLQAVLAGDAVP